MSDRGAFAAVLADDSFVEAAVRELESIGYERANVAVASRSSRRAAALARDLNIEALSSPLGVRDEFVARGIDLDRAAYFDEQLANGGVALVIEHGDRDAAALSCLVRLGADLGMHNAAGLVATIPLRRETLDVRKNVVIDNEVVIRTDVVTEKRVLEIELVREELVIERTNGASGASDIIRIPLKHEEAILDKRVIVTAEVDVRTEQHVDSSVVEETVSYEVLRIEDPTNTTALLRGTS